METESISEVLYFGTRRPFHFEGVETLDTAITDMSACSVNYWLLKVRSRSKQLFWGTLSFPFVVLNYLRTEARPS